MKWMEKIRLPHVGFRKVKSVLAIFVGFWFWQLLRLFFPALEAHPIFIYIYGMIEIRDTSEKTLDFGKKRIKSTFTALGVGIPCMVLLETLKGVAPEGWIHTGLELIIIIGGVLLTLEVAQKVGCKFLLCCWFLIPLTGCLCTRFYGVSKPSPVYSSPGC